jgi:steroid delta-isomerase-like uncharacterized protein
MTRERIDRVAATDRTAGQMTREEIVAFFNRRQEAFDCIVESPMAGTHQTRAAVERVYRAVFDAFLDHKVRTETLVIDGNRVAQVVSLEGTDIGGFMGLPPTGKGFRVPAVFLFELKDHLIVRERRIYDFTGLLLQIGVLKAKPV